MLTLGDAVHAVVAKDLRIRWEKLAGASTALSIVAIFVMFINIAFYRAWGDVLSFVSALCSAFSAGWLAALATGAIR
jgi:hypothetical protein